MQPHFGTPPEDHPKLTLPILSAEEVRRSQREKYGALFYLGIAGLVVTLALITWFTYSAWTLRHVWRDIYVLHDRRRPEAERIEAAYALSRDQGVTPRQLWDISLRRDVPPLARYLVAEALPAETVGNSPRAYALSVARSEGWPGWLRLLLVRPLAYAAADGRKLPREPLEELRRNADPAIRLWAVFTLAAVGDDPKAAAELEESATAKADEREFARLLNQALQARGGERRRCLDAATLWLRSHHPESARLWNGWNVRENHLVPTPASESR